MGKAQNGHPSPITKNWELCSAQKRACPYGKNTFHGTREEYEQVLEGQEDLLDELSDEMREASDPDDAIARAKAFFESHSVKAKTIAQDVYREVYDPKTDSLKVSVSELEVKLNRAWALGKVASVITPMGAMADRAGLFKAGDGDRFSVAWGSDLQLWVTYNASGQQVKHTDTMPDVRKEAWSDTRLLRSGSNRDKNAVELVRNAEAVVQGPMSAEKEKRIRDRAIPVLKEIARGYRKTENGFDLNLDGDAGALRIVRDLGFDESRCVRDEENNITRFTSVAGNVQLALGAHTLEFGVRKPPPEPIAGFVPHIEQHWNMEAGVPQKGMWIATRIDNGVLVQDDELKM